MPILVMRVFISHSSKDKPTVRPLVDALLARGFEPWFDEYEIRPGDDIVKKINDGLENADAGIVVFSSNTQYEKWLQAEWSALILDSVEEGRRLIPVLLGDDKTVIPRLLRAKLYVRAKDIDRIDDALRNRPLGPAPGTPAERPQQTTVVITLRREANQSIHINTTVDGEQWESHYPGPLSASLQQQLTAFYRGAHTAATRDTSHADYLASQRNLEHLGAALGRLCFSEAIDTELSSLCQARIGHTLSLCFESDDATLLSLPFEALRLRDGPPGSATPGRDGAPA